MKDFTDILIEDTIDEASLNYWEQEQKMDAWHNGSRGLNIKACSDSKLELNWKICKAKGYTNEAQQLEAEGRSRGLAWAQPVQPAPQPQPQSQPKNNLSELWDKFNLTPELFTSIMGKHVLDRENNDPMMIVADFLGQSIPFDAKIKLITLALILAIILKCNKCTSEIMQALSVNNHPEVKAALKNLISRVLADTNVKAKLEEIKNELENANESLDEKIVHLDNDDWQVQSEKGRNMGTYDTKKEAEKRLGQVEYFKYINEAVSKDLEEKVREIVKGYLSEDKSRLTILEYDDGYDGFVEEFGEDEDGHKDVIDFGKFICRDLSDEDIEKGKPVITFLLSGGLNGSGKWEDYLKDVSKLFEQFKKELGLHAIVYKMDTDICDDVWTAEVLLYVDREETKESLNEDLIVIEPFEAKEKIEEIIAQIEESKDWRVRKNLLTLLDIYLFQTLYESDHKEETNCNIDKEDWEEYSDWTKEQAKKLYDEHPELEKEDKERDAKIEASIKDSSSEPEQESEEPIEEGIEKHDALNPKLFDENNHLRPEVREKLLQIADEFIKGIKDDEVKFILKDIKLVGSNASYNYNPDSDMDLHLVADTESLGCPDDLYPIIYNLYKSAWNNKFTPTIHGIPVELYVETEADKAKEEPKEESAEKLEEKAMADVPFDSDAKVGDKIRIIHMAGEDSSYDNIEGTIEDIDGIGQLHGSWGGLAVIPGVDEFEIISKELEEAKKPKPEPKKMTLAEWDDWCREWFMFLRKKGVAPEDIEMPTPEEMNIEVIVDVPEPEDDDLYESVEDTKRLISEEEDAEKSYQKAINNSESTEKEKELYKHIKDEESEHKEELNKLLAGEENPIEEAMNRNALVSNGLYSVLDDKWIKEPVATEVPEVNQEEIDKALAPWLLRYNEILKAPTIEAIESFMDDLYKARQASIANEGEYNPTNHAFKSLRAAGNLDNLREIKRELKEKELSLE